MKKTTTIFIIILFYFSQFSINASEILPTTLEESTLSSELIFEGTVISVQERMFNGKVPFTYFTFKVISIIKSNYTPSTIELGFMGGKGGNGQSLQVMDMEMPKIGEHGIYFVESLSRQQINPLYGWNQGHYLVIHDSKSSRDVVTPVSLQSGLNVTAVDLTQFKQRINSIMRLAK